ncbi:MAG: hypothetical protein ACTSR8_11295 [Promethearchaeota archaeon]
MPKKEGGLSLFFVSSLFFSNNNGIDYRIFLSGEAANLINEIKHNAIS